MPIHNVSTISGANTAHSRGLRSRMCFRSSRAIVPNITRESLVRIAERIRANVEAMPPVPETAPVTLSIGAAMYPRDGDGADALFVKADERLYQAKKEGRNRVVAPAA